MRSIRDGAEKAAKATANTVDHLETVFSRGMVFGILVGARSAALKKCFEQSFQGFSRHLRKG